MAVAPSFSSSLTLSYNLSYPSKSIPLHVSQSSNHLKLHKPHRTFPISISSASHSCRSSQRDGNDPLIISETEPNPEAQVEVESVGVKAALSMLNFYKREISPVMPKSCRYVPTCSEYSMIAYKKYGVAKGTVLTAWRLCRCNPLGGSGFDPPCWFGEEKTTEE